MYKKLDKQYRIDERLKRNYIDEKGDGIICTKVARFIVDSELLDEVIGTDKNGDVKVKDRLWQSMIGEDNAFSSIKGNKIYLKSFILGKDYSLYSHKDGDIFNCKIDNFEKIEIIDRTVDEKFEAFKKQKELVINRKKFKRKSDQNKKIGRAVINGFVSDFKESNKNDCKKCPKCGVELNYERYSHPNSAVVDHLFPDTFSSMFARWKIMYELADDFDFTDVSKIDWYDYHQEYCNLRIICRKCNSTISNKTD